MAIPLSAKAHFELCLKEQKHYVNARSHCRLAKLYEDFDQQTSDLVEFELQVKWKKVKEAAEVLKRILKSRLLEEALDLLKKIILHALAERSVEREIFTELSMDLFEQIVNSVTKHFGDDSLFMCQLQLFILDISSEEKYAKLAKRALNFLIDRADADTDLHDGVSQFHVLIAVLVAPALLERRINLFKMEDVNTIITFAVHVIISWATNQPFWLEKLKIYLPRFETDALAFSEKCWDIVRDLLAKFITSFNQGSLPTLQTNPSDCEGFAKSMQSMGTVKAEAKKLSRFVFVWRAYCVWKEKVSPEDMLIWIPESKWSCEVDKIIDEASGGSPEKSSPPAKRSRSSRERRITLSAVQADIPLIPACDQLARAYELCVAAVSDLISSTSFLKSLNALLKLTDEYEDIHRFISESLIFKMKTTKALLHLNERVSTMSKIDEDVVLNLHLVCANALERNWAEAFSVLVSLLPQSSAENEGESLLEESDPGTLLTSSQARFCIEKSETAVNLVFDYLHHILYKVYTSTTLDHENDELLGSLLIVSQINFSVQGFRSFNRIIRHIEAKGSLNKPGLAKYIVNITILEELARIQEFCCEYVSIQIAPPQVQRRIGQSTRHSVRGTRDGQKQALEEQIRKEGKAPVKAVVAFFTDNQESILQILKNR